jgi:hypothetical protein
MNFSNGIYEAIKQTRFNRSSSSGSSNGESVQKPSSRYSLQCTERFVYLASVLLKVELAWWIDCFSGNFVRIGIFPWMDFVDAARAKNRIIFHHSGVLCDFFLRERHDDSSMFYANKSRDSKHSDTNDQNCTHHARPCTCLSVSNKYIFAIHSSAIKHSISPPLSAAAGRNLKSRLHCLPARTICAKKFMYPKIPKQSERRS